MKEKPTVYMMLGLPGSGKTTFSKQLQEELDAPRFSLDEEYFAKVGNTGQEHRDFDIERQIGETIKARTAGLLATGQSVILDLCPWKRSERIAYKAFIEKSGGKCHIYYFDVPKEELLRRLDTRNKQDDQAAQFMRPEMLNDFYERFDVPNDTESVEVVK